MPAVEGLLRHRLLLSWRTDPALVAPLLPDGFRPQEVRGAALVGVCVLRLEQLRPAGLPRWAGVRVDAAAHRVAVERPDHGGAGVYILRRDAAQRLPVLLGGRVLPGVHRRASFAVSELTDSGSGSGGGLRIAIRGGDAMALDVVARATDGWAGGAFESVGEAAEFYRAGALGWSPARRGSALEGIELCSEPWVPQAVAVDARSSFWEEHVPPAALELDGALLLRDLPVRWQPRAVSASPAGAAVR